MVPLGGIAGQYVFLAGMFEKIGVRWEYSRVGEYKSAVEQFAAKEMSPKATEMSAGLIDGIYAQLIDGLAAGRNLSGEQVRALFEQGAGNSRGAGRRRARGRRRRQEGRAREGGARGANEVDAATYQRVDPRSLGLRNGPEIALVFGDGAIVPERSRGFGNQFSADEVGDALEAAAKDDAIRAVVLRINSPGGDAMASDHLWRAVKHVREKKPVVVSMGDYAASGGYYIASAGNAILSQPATLTGSIGVFMLRPVFAGLYDKLDIGRELIARGGLASVAGGDGPLNAFQRDRLDQLTRSAYHELPRARRRRPQLDPRSDRQARRRTRLARQRRARAEPGRRARRPLRRGRARAQGGEARGRRRPGARDPARPARPDRAAASARAGRSQRARAALAPALRAARHARARLALADRKARLPAAVLATRSSRRFSRSSAASAAAPTCGSVPGSKPRLVAIESGAPGMRGS